MEERVASLGRMAARWTSANGTPYDLWRADAANHVNQLPGLRTLEWIDADYRIRWAEPLSGVITTRGVAANTARPTRSPRVR